MRPRAAVIAACVLVGGCGGPHRPTTSRRRGRPLAVADVRALVEEDERRLEEAYGAGDASHLAEFLAGSQLRGNAGTIGVLNSRHQRNVFHIVVDDVSVISNDGDRAVVAVRDHTTENRFVDTTTGETLNSGLPGPEAQAFALFFDRNPRNGHWYWTGAQKQQK